LTSPLPRVDVSQTAMGTPLATVKPLVAGQPVPWVIYDLELSRIGPAYVASLAVEAQPGPF
jgi:hypothetical protein